MPDVTYPCSTKAPEENKNSQKKETHIEKNGPLTMLENHTEKSHEEVFILTTKKQGNYYDMNLSGISKRLRLPA